MIERSGIYVIINQSTGKVYVGSASNISKRWSRHRKDLRDKKHANMHLQLAWNKYSEEDFVFRVLEFADKDNLDSREQHWMDYYDATNNKLGYNLAPIARSTRGRKWTELERSLRIPNMTTAPMNTPEIVAKRIKTLRANGSIKNQKLDWIKVCEIRDKYGHCEFNGKGRKLRKNGGVTLQSLADEYGIGMLTVYDVVRWVTWKTEPEKPEVLQLIQKDEIRSINV